MKPHLIRRGNIWRCMAIASRTGLGYTPTAAYWDWRAMHLNQPFWIAP